MPRIKFVSDEAQRAYDAAETPAERVGRAFTGILSHMPETNCRLVDTLACAKHEGTLSQRLIELTRIRTAYWTQCRTCMTMRFDEAIADGLDQNAVCSLERPEATDHLDPAERAAIAFVDKFANDWLGIDDSDFDALRVHFTEQEIVQLGMITSLHYGTGRFMAALAVTEDLPETMQGEAGAGRFKPWDIPLETLVLPALPRAEDLPPKEWSES